MAKAIYLGDNTSRKVKKIYEGNGTAQKIKKGYIGDASGKARLFFSGSYRWNRYSILTQYQWNVYNTIYTEQVAGTANAEWSTPLLFAQSDTFAAALSKPALNTINGTYSVSGGIIGNLELTGTTFAVSSTASSIIVFPQQVKLTISLGSGGRAILYSYFMDPIPYTTYRAVQGKWTFIQTVQSTNQSQYPTNGVSGNLWYEYTGMVNTIGSFIDTVESDNENAYPNNGVSGNYWYVKIT